MSGRRVQTGSICRRALTQETKRKKKKFASDSPAADRFHDIGLTDISLVFSLPSLAFFFFFNTYINRLSCTYKTIDTNSNNNNIVVVVVVVRRVTREKRPRRARTAAPFARTTSRAGGRLLL